MSGSLAITGPDGHGVATVTLNQPARKNAISAVMWREITAFAAAAPGRQDMRVVIFGGAEGNFSVGADISGFAEARSGTHNAGSYDDLVESTCLAVGAMPQPTIAMIEGYCIGAGLSLASSCDIRVAGREVRFAVPAARLGLGYDPRGIARLQRLAGPNAAARLLFTAEQLPAAEAHSMGFVQYLTETGETRASAESLAARIAANAPLTVQAAKMALRAAATGDEAIRQQALKLYAEADASADYAEGRAAFAEKRKPAFKGR